MCPQKNSHEYTLSAVHAQHQTKCQEFCRRAKSPLLQPDIEYLAPEIWKSAKCSHKSDLFSFGLLLGQTYDLCQHRAPLNCRSRPANYEPGLRRVSEACKLMIAERRPRQRCKWKKWKWKCGPTKVS